MGKKSGATATSKISSTSALANTTTTTTTSGSSSILKSSFAPTYLQLHLFASVIQSFESQQLRIHDASNGRLRQQHAAPAGINITCLDWGYYGQSYREQRNSNKKKRKRVHNSQEDAVVAYGTSSSTICMYSPAEDKVVGVLKAGHEREIKDFRFLPSDNLQAWSIGADSKLVQWNLDTDQATRSISLADSLIQSLCIPSTTPPQIICASVTPYAIHLESKDDFRISAYDAFKNPVHSLLRSPNRAGSPQTFLAADQNRYVNLYDVVERKILRTLVASGDIDSVALYEASVAENSTAGEEVLAIVTRDGTVDLFSKPFALLESRNGDMKAKRKGLTRKADASIRLTTDDAAKTPFPVFSVSFEGPNLVIASVDGGVEPVFQKHRWQDEGSGDLLFDGIRLVTRARSASATNATSMNGAKDMGSVRVNDARAVVTNGIADVGSQAAPLEIDSDSGVDEEEDEGSELENSKDGTGSEAESAEESDEEMQDIEKDTEAVNAADADQEVDAEPSFGDLLAIRHPNAISIIDALPADHNALASLPQQKQVMLPSGLSLGTVLTQSLKTNDQSLLETCLHVTEEHVIRNTILRLDSSLAANLLTKLAERLANRPGRYGHLLTWVQLTMIAHGGAIASQAGVASKLRTLYQVLNERSKILPNILLLKGKLDMMNAQQSFRAQAEAHRQGIESAGTNLYIEGEEDNWSSDEDVDEVPSSRRIKSKSRATRDLNELIGGAESSEDEGMPLVNGDYHSDDEDEDDSDEDASRQPRINGILDDEAEVSGEDVESGTDDGESEGDEDDEEEEDSSMDDFINDGEISEVEAADEIALDEDDSPPRPAKKKSKHR